MGTFFHANVTMASIRRKPRSPYWMMRYLNESGQMVERSTKEVNRKKAREPKIAQKPLESCDSVATKKEPRPGEVEPRGGNASEAARDRIEEDHDARGLDGEGQAIARAPSVALGAVDRVGCRDSRRPFKQRGWPQLGC